ncbi:kinase-like domain-containing protein [Schizophyllum commune]
MTGCNITPDEQFWVDHFTFLERRGYRLRCRYNPAHIPARQQGKKPWWLPQQFYRPEDELENMSPCVLDAVRLSDGRQVVIRKAETWKDEIPVYQRLARLPKDSRNRLAPLLDIILLPDTDSAAFLVLPFLREYYDPPFSRIDQVVQCLSQLLEALQYLHEHNIAHRDFCAYNLMMDASELLPGGHHFAAPYKAPDGRSSLVFRDRADVSPVQYFVIDLGLATQMQDNDGLVTGVYGQDKSVPELSWDVPYNPFKVDVYQLGNVILQDMLGIYSGLEFLRPLAESMTQRDPQSRPTSSEALQIFTDTLKSLPSAFLNQTIQVVNPFGGQIRDVVETNRIQCIPRCL